MYFVDPKFDCTVHEFRRFLEQLVADFVIAQTRVALEGGSESMQEALVKVENKGKLRLSHAEWVERFEAWLDTKDAQESTAQHIQRWAQGAGLLESTAGR